MILIEYAPCKKCNNPDTFGMICVKCGECGREFSAAGICTNIGEYPAYCSEWSEWEDDESVLDQ